MFVDNLPASPAAEEEPIFASLAMLSEVIGELVSTTKAGSAMERMGMVGSTANVKMVVLIVWGRRLEEEEVLCLYTQRMRRLVLIQPAGAGCKVSVYMI